MKRFFALLATLMAGAGYLGAATVAPTVYGDFNGDGYADILWKKDNGKYTIKLMDSTGQIGTIWFGGGMADWVVESINDFNGDGRADRQQRQVRLYLDRSEERLDRTAAGCKSRIQL